MIEVDNVFWIPEHDEGITDINDPFSGVEIPRLPLLLRAYDTWCLDMRIAELREGKAFGTTGARTGTRDNIFLSRLQSTPNYQRHLRTAKTQGKKELERLMGEARPELRALLRQYDNEDISFAELKRETEDWFKFLYGRIFTAGRKASGLERFMPEKKMSAGETTWLKSALAEEMKYWRKFLDQLRTGEVVFKDKLDPDAVSMVPPRRKYTVEERLDMYFTSLEAVFENGRVSGMPQNLLFYWFGPKPKTRGICSGCAYIVEHQPFTKTTLPAVPRSGATPCLMRCRHKLIVRKAPLEEVVRRKAALPARETMVRTLNSIKRSRGRYRVPGAKRFPWVQK